MSAVNIPVLVFADVVLVTPSQKVCASLFSMDPRREEIYLLFSRVLVFAVPLAITWSSYIGIYFKMISGKKKVAIFNCSNYD